MWPVGRSLLTAVLGEQFCEAEMILHVVVIRTEFQSRRSFTSKMLIVIFFKKQKTVIYKLILLSHGFFFFFFQCIAGKDDAGCTSLRVACRLRGCSGPAQAGPADADAETWVSFLCALPLASAVHPRWVLPTAATAGAAVAMCATATHSQWMQMLDPFTTSPRKHESDSFFCRSHGTSARLMLGRRISELSQ